MTKIMNEGQWVELIAVHLRESKLGSFQVRTKQKLAYGHEVTSYGDTHRSKTMEFETDLAILEAGDENEWKPRVVIETKVGRVTTHDAIIYSQKASSHRAVHPYLRYGIMLGHRRRFPLPGRLYRHGAHFDFMMSFVGYEPTKEEMESFIKTLKSEIAASRTLERVLYDSRKRDREHYAMLQRRLIVS